MKANSRKSSDVISEKPHSKSSSEKSKSSNKRKRGYETGNLLSIIKIGSTFKNKKQKLVESNEGSKLCLEEI